MPLFEQAGHPGLEALHRGAVHQPQGLVAQHRRRGLHLFGAVDRLAVVNFAVPLFIRSIFGRHFAHNPAMSLCNCVRA